MCGIVISFDGSVRISAHLERTQASRSSEPASYIPCRFHFIFRLTDFTGHLQDAQQWVDAAIAIKREVDWLRDRSVASYLCASGCLDKHSPQFSAELPYALPE